MLVENDITSHGRVPNNLLGKLNRFVIIPDSGVSFKGLHWPYSNLCARPGLSAIPDRTVHIIGPMLIYLFQRWMRDYIGRHCRLLTQ